MGSHGDIHPCCFPGQAVRKMRHMFKAFFGCLHEAKNYIVEQMRIKTPNPDKPELTIDN